MDVNVLVALTNESHLHHAESHRWLESADSWATTPITESGLTRMLLNPAVTGRKLTRADALQVIAELRRQPRAGFLPDASTLAEPDIDLAGLVGHKQVTDLHLVNLAAGSGAVLATFDRRIQECLAPADQGNVHVISARPRLASVTE
ncbi:TA system VapC family ribonuclease toxin [Nocardioides speluncae]|uniref:TA system VapC family ribonuclease toxin n=1 Tax=Nocardioides speluncae TaxID=2670337 RepID=UPI0023E7C22B|nr:TA system VapC family ribonuclease toxin [Nocardioides speluncae]